MAEIAEPIGLLLMGGDTTQGPLTISLQVHGYIEPEFSIKRSNAKIGDDIYVTGLLGNSAAAVPIMTGEKMVNGDLYEYFYDVYWRPVPRLIAGMALKRVVTAMLDISDGVIQDIQHILTASNVGAELDAVAIPISNVLREWQPENALELALTGGDDYELCFTAPESAREEVALVTNTLHLDCTCIGKITESGFSVKGYEGEHEGWQHFDSN